MSIIGEIAYKLMPVGSFLADLEKRTKNATDHAAERGDVFLANAGDKVYRAIKNAQTAYYESLDKTIDKIDNEGQKFFESIDLAVRNVETSAERTSKELRDSLHSIMDRIPFLKTQPQLMEIEGAVITRSSYTNSFPVTLQGYFPEIGQQWPTLEINGVVLHPNDVTYFNLARNLARNVFSILGWTAVGVGGVGMVNRSWKFYDYFTFSKVYGREDESSEGEYFTMILAAGAACLVFSHLCFGNNAGNADHATLRKITFDVPFDKLGPDKGTVDLVKGVVKFPRKSWIFNYSDDFPIRITVLPNSPGTILLRSTYPKIQNFEKDRETFISEVELHSSKTDRKGDQESRIFIQAPPWWELDLKTKKIEMPAITTGKKYPLPKGVNGKSYGYELITATKDRVEYRIWTKALGNKKSGWAVFRLQCEATCIQRPQAGRVKIEQINLNWGSSVVRDVPSDFHVSFVAFDGTSSEFARQDLSNPYIEIKKLTGNKLEIKAKRPNEIKF